MLSHFINLRNVMKYKRWSEWWHLILLKASEEILSEYTGIGYSMNCVPATGNCRVAATAEMNWRLGVDPLAGMSWKSANLLYSPIRTKPRNHIKNGQPSKTTWKYLLKELRWLQGSAQRLNENSWNTASNSTKSFYWQRLILCSRSRLNLLQKSRTGVPPKRTASSLPVTA